MKERCSIEDLPQRPRVVVVDAIGSRRVRTLGCSTFRNCETAAEKESDLKAVIIEGLYSVGRW
jgi:hypothetical protein